MRKLTKPLPNIKPEDIFEECVSGYRDLQKVTTLLQCKDMVRCDSEEYEKSVPSNLGNYSVSSLPSNVQSKEIVNVYTTKFAAEDSPGRKYYNAIKEQAVRNVCPICGIRIVKTLDHYLPKSKFPTLAVTPSNLIPSCRDCNIDKRDSSSLDSQNTPIHLYFDDIPDDVWLYVTVGDNLEILYYISCPETWEEGIRKRLEKHLDYYELHELYSSHAADEIANNLHLWKQILLESDSEILRLAITDVCASVENCDKNSWKAALYRGLVADFDKVITYLMLQDTE